MFKLHNWLNLLIESCTLYGGGKGGGSPDTPDYAEIARQQAASQIDINRQTTQANRPDQYTPYGSITWSQGGGTPTFDQAGYDNALRQYQLQMSGGTAPRSSFNSGYIGDVLSGNGTAGTGYASGSLAAPNRNDYMRAGSQDKWTSTTKLTPELQAILDQNIAAKGQGYQQLQDALGRINSNSLPQGPINPGQTAQDAIYARLNPEMDRQRAALASSLANQGINIGSEAYNNEMDRFGRQTNDAYSQAALQGIGLDFQNRNQALSEQAIPINLINAYQSGNQAQMPSFQNFSQQANAQSPDLMGAAQNSYSGQLGAANAQNAASANTTNGLIGLAGTAAMMGF